ncbi:OmpA family protein [Cellulomonas soli]|uniref:OmpA-like domain-containing protein n=1 Tax=Cellulomonas soli TaxID=931535 RepID=A0A512P8V2_9CELL|nr:OmpA family protein [Cellulomonas soli]NYI57850.1 outer membrane protein OmpA-like peptidoglycan-associated protein [Cellulomonas soli]GEP67634.1 hypothetical protein CSO01_03490 [Cellulomonas soli]
MTRTVDWQGLEVELKVGPVVVADGIGVLRLQAQGVGGEGEVPLGVLLQDPYLASLVGPTGVRLVDLAGRAVSPVALTPDGVPVVTSGMLSVEPEGQLQVAHLAFAAPQADHVAVMIPQTGLVTDVPVVVADTEAGSGLDDLTDSLAGSLEAPVYDLETYTEQVDGQVRARVTPEQVDVDVASDVLFASDQDVLGAEADAALLVAGAQIAAAGGGVLQIVGHTDDVADDAYNQALSERRAQAVQTRLAELVDLSSYDVSVEGRGESEPAVTGTDDAARALNRRVQLVLTPEQGSGIAPAPSTTATPGAPSGSIPDPEGPSAPGVDGVEIAATSGADTARFGVSVEQVRRVDGFVVGELTVTELDGVDRALVGAFATAAWDARGEFNPQLQAAATRVTLLDGGTRVFPVDYQEGGSRSVLADTMLRGLGAGRSLTMTVVWPDVSGESVVIDAPQVRHDVLGVTTIEVGGPPFRLTDVPVES